MIYEKPTLIELGSIAELTEQEKVFGSSDGFFIGDDDITFPS